MFDISNLFNFFLCLGAGFRSKLEYSSGFFRMRIKIPSKDSLGVVTAFYVRNLSYSFKLRLSLWLCYKLLYCNKMQKNMVDATTINVLVSLYSKIFVLQMQLRTKHRYLTMFFWLANIPFFFFLVII